MSDVRRVRDLLADLCREGLTFDDAWEAVLAMPLHRFTREVVVEQRDVWQADYERPAIRVRGVTPLLELTAA